MTAASEHACLVSEAAELITATLRGAYSADEGSEPADSIKEGDRLRIAYLTSGLQNYAEQTLRKIISLQHENVTYWHYTVIDNVVSGRVCVDESFLLDYLHLSRCFKAILVNNRIAEAILAVESFQHYEGLTQHSPGQEYSEQRKEQCSAILSTVEVMRKEIASGNLTEDHLRTERFHTFHERTRSLTDSYGNGRFHIINDEKLRRLLTDSTIDLAAATSIITERRIINAQDILEMLEAQRSSLTPAVNSGIL